MKRFVLLFSFVGLVGFCATGYGQNVEFHVAPQTGSCGGTLNVAPGATVEIPLELSLSSDSDVAGFTMSLRVKPDPAIVVEPSDLNGQRTMQFVDLTRVTAAEYSALQFPDPCCANVGDPPVRGDIPVVLRGQEVKDNFPVPPNPDTVPTEGPLAGSPQGPGYTLGIVYNIGNNPIVGPFAIVLPPGDDIVVENNIFIRVTAPDTEGQFPIEFVYEDGLVGGGSPVGNIATINQMSVTPTRGSCTLTLDTAGPPKPPRGPVDLSIEPSSSGRKGVGTTIEVPVGQTGSANVQVILDDNIDDTETDAEEGIEGLQLSIDYDDPIDFTNATVSQAYVDGIPDVDDVSTQGFLSVEFSRFVGGDWQGVDPTLVFDPGPVPDPDCEIEAGEEQGKGLVMGLVNFTGDPTGLDTTLDGSFVGPVLDISLELAEPIQAGETITASIGWQDCKEGSGSVIKTGLTIEGNTVRPRNRSGTILTFVAVEGEFYIRGDANQMGPAGDLADVMFVLMYLYEGGPAPECRDAADANDDDKVDIGDPIYMINAMFREGFPPIPPPNSCDEPDPNADETSCASYPCP